ncbi:hypothetical protein ISF_02674 [Cordyceps fumosorosea ARSEF 2679]|uniref:feruloyl esterase n=1 Tax=Cordyceps fumosorosea (strain ARSEF 2679) TaxID=1081104 RepID=A0A168BY69_CORFA|nr:hypothetical protein ISF_02674 [Cordyceps fumosorosea ARSEF 2679]OAA70700.1 hypothetical protein ISF_02674 [Cordyceps fumosorosea ARSEF 2679]
MYLPRHYDTDRPTPLILAFHAHREDADEMNEKTRFTNWRFNPTFAVHYLQARRKRWLAGEDHAEMESPDFNYTRTVLDYTMNHYCIDVDRVFLVGESEGSGFANILACDPRFSYHFAGMALSGVHAHGELDLDFCKDARLPMPVLEAHGTIDERASYWGDRKRRLLPVPAWIQRWVRRNGCDPVARRGYLNSERFQWDRYTCQGQLGYVEHIKLSEWEHLWPTQDVWGRGLSFSRPALWFLQRWVRPGNLTIPLKAGNNFDTFGHERAIKYILSGNDGTPSSNRIPGNNRTWGNHTTLGNHATWRNDTIFSNDTILAN